MKVLILVRHAKSSHSFGFSSDFDRPLNDRGLREATDMGKKLLKKNVRIDQFVSSPAVRAKTTAELFAAEYAKVKDILFIPSLYQADPAKFLEIISKLGDSYQHVAVFSHNPGITEFASSLTPTHIDNMPTSSVFAVTSPIGTWNDFGKAEKSFLFFYKPD